MLNKISGGRPARRPPLSCVWPMLVVLAFVVACVGPSGLIRRSDETAPGIESRDAN